MMLCHERASLKVRIAPFNADEKSGGSQKYLNLIYAITSNFYKYDKIQIKIAR